jgi:tRNA/rRNA methyltransferase
MPWQDHLRIVLVQARNPLNIGAAARAMLNFGFSNLWLVKPYDVAFQGARSAVGAGQVLRKARVTDSLNEALGDSSLVVGTSAMRRRADSQVQRLLPEGGLALRTHLETKPAALVFGSEKHGLGKRDLSHCDWVLSIPTEEVCPSMNLGQAVALCCYEVARRALPTPQLQTPATAAAEHRDRIVTLLAKVLEDSGFTRPQARASQLLKVRRLVNRLRLAPQDARLLQGMLRQIQWKLDQP